MMTTSEKEQHSAFACSCRHSKRWKVLERWVHKTFGVGRCSPHPAGRNRDHWMTQLLYVLEGYDVEITGMGLDQWGILFLEGPHDTFSIQFDRFEDALHLAIRQLYKKHGKQ